MWRKVLIVFIYLCITSAAIAYFYSAWWLNSTAADNERCTEIHVTLQDSSINKFVTKQEVVEIINNYYGHTIGKKNSEINLAKLENLLNLRSAVKESQVSITRDGVLNVEIRQRKPVMRIETKNGGFYIDEDAFIFPLIEKYTSYVPIATGNIPFYAVPEQQAVKKTDSLDCIARLLELGKFLESNPFWNSQIEQIYFEENGDVIMYPRVGKQKIIFGTLDNIEEKFNKLSSFYKYIVPGFGWEKYSVVNLKFRRQIVCTLSGHESETSKVQRDSISRSLMPKDSIAYEGATLIN